MFCSNQNSVSHFSMRTCTVHPPDLDLAVICSWHNERHAGMEGCPVYASIVTLRPEQENANFHSNQQQTSFIQPQPYFTTQRFGSSFFFRPLQLHSYLQNMLHYCIRGPKQVDTRDAAHLRVHSTRRQVLLPQTWKQHLQSDTQGTVYKLHRNTHIPGREERGTTLQLLLKNTCDNEHKKHFVGLVNIRWYSRTQTQQMSSIRSKPELRKYSKPNHQIKSKDTFNHLKHNIDKLQSRRDQNHLRLGEMHVNQWQRDNQLNSGQDAEKKEGEQNVCLRSQHSKCLLNE